MGIRFPCAAGVRCVIGGASGKSAKRRQRRMKRAGFEEVPRLAATIVDGNRLARRWAVAAPYDPNGGRCGGIRMSLLRCPKFSRCLTAAA